MKVYPLFSFNCSDCQYLQIICQIFGKVLLKVMASATLLDYIFSLHVNNSFIFILSTLEKYYFSYVLLNPLLVNRLYKQSFSLEQICLNVVLARKVCCFYSQ